jgi:ribosomal protein S12 methylthiotransferase
VREIVLVAQDLAAYGRDHGVGERSIVRLVREAVERVDRVRLLYLYPSDLTDALIDAHLCHRGPVLRPVPPARVGPAGAPHASVGQRGAVPDERIADIRRREPGAAFRSNFIVGYPGETEEDHDQLLRFVEPPSSTGAGSSPTHPKMELTPPGWTARYHETWSRNAWPSCGNCKTR